jgi:YgiT-type zinc finger domain-containing protein
MAKTMDACEYCSTPLRTEERPLTVYRHRRGRHFIFEQVPGRVCAGCGERYFSASVVRAMEAEMRTRAKRPTVAVPVIAFRATG